MAAKKDKLPPVGSHARHLIEAAETLGQLTEYRNDLIAKRRRSGATLRQIASEAGISHTAVAKILARS